MMNHNKQLFSFFVNCPMLLQDHLDELNGQRWSNSINTWANLTETTCLVTNLNFLVEIQSITKTNCRVRRQCSTLAYPATSTSSQARNCSSDRGSHVEHFVWGHSPWSYCLQAWSNNNNNNNNDNNNNNNNNHDSDFSDRHVTGIVVGIFGSEDVYFFSTIIDPNEHELQKVWGHSW